MVGTTNDKPVMPQSRGPEPRWWRPRAERLAAAIVELTLEAQGHAGLLDRLGDAAWGRSLGAALGLGERPSLPRVARLLARCLDDHDATRLSLKIAAGAVRLDDGRRGPLFLVDGERVLAFAPRRSPVDVERRLGAAQLLAHASTPAALGFGHRPPGRGPRELAALALISDLIVERAPEPRLLALAFGSIDAPNGVLVSVFDRALRDLEQMLHKAPPALSRATPLLWLHDERSRLEGRAPRYVVERFLSRDRRLRADLCGRARGDERPVARAPRRPARRSYRDLGWTPPVFEAPRRALDLFAP
jgi:hypothetical protein